MRRLLLTLLITIPLATFGQVTIDELKSNSSPIDGRMSNRFYRQEGPQYREFRSILNLDVFEYYDLKDTYDSELKQKVFKESDEYKAKLTALQKVKSELISKQYYIDLRPANRLEYNLTTKTFAVNNEVYSKSEYKKIGFVQFDEIVLKNPIGLSVSKSRANYGGVDFVIQDILFKIPNESLALKIEENKSSIRFLFIFSFTGTSPFQDNILDMTTFTSYHLMANTKKVIVYNADTNEIYHSF